MSEARIGISTNTKSAEQGVTTVRGLFSSLQADAKKSILTGVGLGAGVSAFNLLSNAAGSAIGFLKGAAEEAIHDEESVNRLAASLKANVPNWDGNTKAIEANITASQRLGFSDEELRDSLTVLVGATHDVAQAQTIMATAQDLARFKGIDLRTASEALIKVEGGHYRSLQQLGIKLREGATSTEALAAVQKVAAGQAETFGDTAAGAAAAVSIAISELQEDIGRELLPVIKELAVWARDELVPALQGVVTWVKENSSWIGMLAEGVGNAIDPYRHFRDALVETGEALQKSDEALTEYEASLRGAVPGMETAAGDFAGALPDALSTAGKDAKATVRATLKDLVASLVGGQTDWQKAWDNYGQIMEDDLTDAEEIAQLQGILTGKALADGLNSTDTERRQAAEAMKATIEERLFALTTNARQLAIQMGTSYAEGITATKSLAQSNTAEIAAAIRANLNFPAKAEAWGYNIGTSWTSALISALKAGYTSLYSVLDYYRSHLAGFSPPKEGPLKDIDKGGFNVGKSWAQNLAKGMGRPDLTGLSRALSVASPNAAGGLAMAGAASGGGGNPVVIQLQVDGRVLAEIVDRHLYYQAATYGPFGRG